MHGVIQNAEGVYQGAMSFDCSGQQGVPLCLIFHTRLSGPKLHLSHWLNSKLMS